MASHPEPADGESELAQLLALAVQLKKTAVRAGRLDVAAKADEAIVLVADAGADRQPGRDDKANAVLRILDGLGF